MPDFASCRSTLPLLRKLNKMVLKYKNFRYYNQSQKYRRGSYSYGRRSSSNAALASLREIKHLQKRLKKSNRPIRMEFYKKYHRIQKRRTRRSFERQPAKRYVYSSKTKSKFYYGHHFAKSKKSKKSVKRISRKFSTYKNETRSYKRKSSKIVVPKKARKLLKKTISQDGDRKRKPRKGSNSFLKFLKNTVPFTKKKSEYFKNSHKEKFTSENIPVQTTEEKLSVEESKDCVVASDVNINKTDVQVSTFSAANSECISKELETSEEKAESAATGNTELTAVKGSLDLTAAVDIDLTTRVDSVDLTEEIADVDLTQTLKEIVDHPEEVVMESEIIEAPTKDENAYELTTKKNLFKVEVDEPLSEKNVQEIPY